MKIYGDINLSERCTGNPKSPIIIRKLINERPRILTNLTAPEPLAVFKIKADTESEVFEYSYESDLLSLLCELGGLAVVLGFFGRTLTSCLSKRLFLSSLIRKTMQIKG